MDDFLWTEEIRQKLFAMQDNRYRLFQARLMPTIDAATIIGIRTPLLRRLAKELAGCPETAAFLAQLPHRYYEENNLHAFLLEQIRDYDACISEIDRFLPYVDNWATCDSMSPKVLKSDTVALLAPIKRWMASGKTYTIRFGIEMLMRFYLDDAFHPEYLEQVAVLRSEEYYVKMMIAWYFATALAKQYPAALPYLERGRLDKWTHNKTIQKACESNRVSAVHKSYLRTLKHGNN